MLRLLPLFLLLCSSAFAQVEITPLDEPARSENQPLPLTVGLRLGPPFVMQNDEGFSGLAIDLWEAIAADLGVDYQYRVLELDPLLTAAATGEVDVAVGALTITPERERLMDFSHPYFRTGLAIASKQQSTGLIGVLRSLVSLDFLLVIGLLGGLLAVLGWLAWLAERRANPEEFGGDVIQGIGQGFWWAAVTMTTVGYGDKSPVTKLGRLLALIWMFAAIILISSFTAAITTSLTVGQLESRIQDPSDLHRVSVLTLRDSSSASWLEGQRIDHNTRRELGQALDNLATGPVQAVVFDDPLLRYELQQNPRAGVGILPFTLEPQDYGFAVREGSELRKPINLALLDVINSEQWETWQRLYFGD